MTEPQKLTWYLPSFYGDIRLERVSNNETRLILVGLSSTEKIALRSMMTEAERSGISKKPWGNAAALSTLDLESVTEQAIVIGAPISQVQKALAKPMKPGRDCLSVVRFKNGQMEEVTVATLGLIETAESPATEKTPVAVVTVAQPTIGCPAPDFEAVELRANRVLRAFLDPQQVRDFDSDQAFVQKGADTGHTYIITSRNAPHALANVSHRSLYDLTEGRAFCVHDWTVPAGEEMLCLALHVATPGKENYVRGIPDDGLHVG